MMSNNKSIALALLALATAPVMAEGEKCEAKGFLAEHGKKIAAVAATAAVVGTTVGAATFAAPKVHSHLFGLEKARRDAEVAEKKYTEKDDALIKFCQEKKIMPVGFNQHGFHQHEALCVEALGNTGLKKDDNEKLVSLLKARLTAQRELGAANSKLQRLEAEAAQARNVEEMKASRSLLSINKTEGRVQEVRVPVPVPVPYPVERVVYVPVQAGGTTPFEPGQGPRFVKISPAEGDAPSSSK